VASSRIFQSSDPARGILGHACCFAIERRVPIGLTAVEDDVDSADEFVGFVTAADDQAFVFGAE
jgi:hypothetical protein